MTETKWLGCSEPSLMLQHLQGKINDRKLRLFMCACWRNVWESLNGVERALVEVSERYVEGLASAEELLGAARELGPRSYLLTLFTADAPESAAEARSAAGSAACVRAVNEEEARRCWKQAIHQQAVQQCAVLRCLVGNPFRPAGVPGECRAWNDGALVKMAQAIYDGRRWNEMPILADALEDAGCTDVVLLDHCRTPTEHARGCHVLDALLGRN